MRHDRMRFCATRGAAASTLMTRRSMTALGLAALGALALPRRPAYAQAGFTSLFDGKSMGGFSPIGDANWRVEDGALVADKGTGFLVSKASYGDFEMKAEIWVDNDANSGIFIRCQDAAKVTSKSAYEVNIFDTRPDPSYGTGAIVDVAKAATVLKTGGKWNVLEIVAKGADFTVILNGVKTVDGAKDSQHARGPFALQRAAGVVKFRKVEIKTA